MAIEKLRQARYHAVRLRPYLASALLRMPLIESDRVGTLGVDAEWRCYYNPHYVEQITTDELVGVLLHEVYHLVLAHHQRMRPYPVAVAQIATDMAVNDMLRREKIVLPGRPIYPEMFKLPSGWTAEQYAEALLKQGREDLAGAGQAVPDSTGGSKGGDAHESGGAEREGDATKAGEGDASSQFSETSSSPASAECASSSSPSGESAPSDSLSASSPQTPQNGFSAPSSASAECASPTGESAPSDSLSASSPQATQNGARPTQGRSGSCAYPKREHWELSDPSAHDGVGEGEAQLLRRQVAQKMQEWAQKNRGDIPEHWVRWAETETRPKRIAWEQEFRAILGRMVAQRAGCQDYSYARPNRRQNAVPDVVLPRLIQRKPSVAVVIDTSGSMTESEIASGVQTVCDIIAQLGDQVRLLSVDAKVHRDQQVRRKRDIEIVGEGGTEMMVGLENLRQHPPDIAIVITDGETEWATVKPAYLKQVIVLLTQESPKITPPTWAKVVRMEVK